MTDSDGLDLQVTNTRVRGYNRPVSIGVSDGYIRTIDTDLDGDASITVDAEGGAVAPSLVDCHVHMDKAFAAEGERLPRYNDEPFAYEPIVETGHTYFTETPVEEIEDNAVRHGLCAVANGTRYLRTHVTVHPDWETRTVEALARARDRLRGLIDVQIVAYSETGILDGKTPDLLADCVDAGCDLIGVMDPASLDGDVDAALTELFAVAADTGVGIDNHLHEEGATGIHTIERLAAKTNGTPDVNDVTISHGFSLSSVTDENLSQALQQVREGGLNVVACHQSIRPEMPLTAMLEADLPVGLGTDNIRDFVYAHGRADLLEGVLTTALRLAGEPTAQGYRSWETTNGIRRLFELASVDGAEVLGVSDHDLTPGSPADFVVFDAPSVEWAVLRRAKRRLVVAGGDVVARNGRPTESALAESGYDNQIC